MSAGLPARSHRGVAMFTWYARRLVAKRFSAARVMRDAPPPPGEGAMILYANHASWWDPLVMLLVARAFYPRQRFYAPVDADALERYPMLGRFGLFGVQSASFAGTRTFVSLGRTVVETPDAILALTPQGRFVDVRERPLALTGGLAQLLRAVPDARAYPVAIEYPFWNEMRPELLIRFGQQPVSCADLSRPALTERLGARLGAEMDTLAAASRARDPRLFDVLTEGGRGIGFWQDLPARLRAWVGGRRFDATHAAVGRDAAGGGKDGRARPNGA